MPGRPVHQSARAGARARPRHALARCRQGLSRGQRSLRRHREGDALLEGRRRHGLDDGEPGSDAGRRARSEARHRLPDLRRRDAERRSRPAARRLAQRFAGQGAEGRKADRRAAGLAAGARRSRRRPGRGREGLRPPDRATTSSPPISCIRRSSRNFRGTVRPLRPGLGPADAGVLLRHAARRGDRHRDRAGQDPRPAA